MAPAATMEPSGSSATSRAPTPAWATGEARLWLQAALPARVAPCSHQWLTLPTVFRGQAAPAMTKPFLCGATAWKRPWYALPSTFGSKLTSNSLSMSPGMHLPALHIEPSVHAPSSSQTSPSFLVATRQVKVVGVLLKQTACSQGLVGRVQESSGPVTH